MLPCLAPVPPSTQTLTRRPPRHSLAAVLCNPFLLVEIHLFLLPPALPRPRPTTLVSLSEGWISKGGSTLVRPLRGGSSRNSAHHHHHLLWLVETNEISLSAINPPPARANPFHWSAGRLRWGSATPYRNTLLTEQQNPLWAHHRRNFSSLLPAWCCRLFFCSAVSIPLPLYSYPPLAFTRNIIVVRVCPLMLDEGWRKTERGKGWQRKREAEGRRREKEPASMAMTNL